MSSFKICFLILLICSGCAQRGYKSLLQDVPELFHDFKAENYDKKETRKNIMYVEKILPKEQKKKCEFYEEEYTLKQRPNSYQYYVPNNRVPASLNSLEVFDQWHKIKSSLSVNEKALLIK